MSVLNVRGMLEILEALRGAIPEVRIRMGSCEVDTSYLMVLYEVCSRVRNVRWVCPKAPLATFFVEPFQPHRQQVFVVDRFHMGSHLLNPSLQ